MRRILAAAALLLPALTTVTTTLEPASAGGPTCRGIEATHVGTPNQPLTTTPGPDVVVTNGASLVRTLNGNDVICATRSRFVYIVPGGGDDLVDAARFRGDTLQTSLGEIGVEGPSGDDTYLGGRQNDQVVVSSGRAVDRKKIFTDGGGDELRIERSYPGRVTARLGVGGDEYWNNRPRAGVKVIGEEGVDQLLSECLGCRLLDLRLATGAIEVNRAPAGSAKYFEDVNLINWPEPDQHQRVRGHGRRPGRRRRHLRRRPRRRGLSPQPRSRQRRGRRRRAHRTRRQGLPPRRRRSR
jgi:hypothetical protein